MWSSLPVYSVTRSSASRRDHAADHVERAVAVERRHLDRHHVVDRGKARARSASAARCRRPRAAGRSPPAASRRRPPRNARSARLRLRLSSPPGSAGPRGSRGRARSAPRARACAVRAGEAGDHEQRALPSSGPLARGLRRELEHRLVQARPRGSRTASSARPPRGHPSRRRGSSASARAGGARSSLRSASSASRCAGITAPRLQHRRGIGGNLGPVHGGWRSTRG